MIIGVPREIKDNEYRVGIVPSGVNALAEQGHRVVVEKEAGLASGFTDLEYAEAGATLVSSATEVYGQAEMVIKVKEPVEPEYELLRENQILFTFLHLAPAPQLTQALLRKKVIGIAYETIRDRFGALPLLTPMSEVAGRMAVHVGAYYLQKTNGGRGNLLGGVPGALPGYVVILGGGVVGTNAAKMAMGLGARVVILDIDLERLRHLDDLFFGRIQTLMSNRYNIRMCLRRADLLLGAVLIPGASAPKLVTRDMIAEMQKGAVAIDVAVDQGGCFETTRATTHSDPTYRVDGVTHYCVANMPGAVPRTSTFALTNATLPYAMKLAKKGVRALSQAEPGFREGINVYRGTLTCEPVAQAQNLPFERIENLLFE